ncbi:helix-turn-helix transcriptional regulator [Cohnella zeiphila]|uniref:AraC family transcriptional regulator n=1 Tax=Cohnella zeiphila TaxID=2761120 RepID=A0A7X0VYU1_9BACL|nr:helix-turn-helix domain-containing protein [Cohnella zeiphila]MBB6734857.1 AraC family transcriptional regulator [Cohnella zeiphila]
MLATLRARAASRLERSSARLGSFYKKSLIMIFIVSGIPGLITGALVYEIAGKRVENELLQLHYRQIEQRSQNIDDQLGNLELLLSHWAFDSKFGSSLEGLDFVKDFETTQDLTKTLIAMQGSNAMVKEAELYVGGEKPVLLGPEYDALDSETAADVYEPLVEGRSEMYWTQWAFDSRHPGTKDLALVHRIPGGSTHPIGALIFRFSRDKVANLLRTMSPYNDGETFVQQDKGELFVSGDGSAYDTPFIAALRDKVADFGAAKGSFFLDWKGGTYTVSFGRLTRIADDWVYVSASPISNITSPVVSISKAIIAVSLAALLLAALLAWLASRRIYSPVRRLVTLLAGHSGGGREDEFALIERQWKSLHQMSLELNTKLDEQLPHIKESFLHQLLQGYLYAYSESDLVRRMEQFKWELGDRRLIVIYVQLIGMNGGEARFREGDEGLVTFAAVNMISELGSHRFEQSDTINFHDLTAGLLVFIPNGEDYARTLHEFGNELTQSINRILNMRVAMAFSRPVPRISDVPLVFERTKQAVGYRDFASDNQIIDLSDERAGKGADAEVPYPFTLERELVQALRTGREDEVQQLLDSFLASLTCAGATVFDVQQGMLHLLGNVQYAMMVSGINPGRLFKGENLYEQLSQIHEPKRMLAWFRRKVLLPFQAELSNRSDAQIKRMIEQAMIFLQDHYAKDISLDNCAEHVGTNPFYLSKSFKQVTGKNFIDYLTELRTDKAKELLRETELRINDVAESVGYQHSYFNRIFKKMEGMTPTRYRELSRRS